MRSILLTKCRTCGNCSWKSSCCLPGPESNLLHCRVSVIKTIKALLDVLTFFETIVKECDFEWLQVSRRQTVAISTACNIFFYNWIISYVRVVIGFGGLNTHKDTWSHMHLYTHSYRKYLSCKVVAYNLIYNLSFDAFLYTWAYMTHVNPIKKTLLCSLTWLAGNGTPMRGQERSLITHLIFQLLVIRTESGCVVKRYTFSWSLHLPQLTHLYLV